MYHSENTTAEQNDSVAYTHKHLGPFTPMNAFMVLPLTLLHNIQSPLLLEKEEGFRTKGADETIGLTHDLITPELSQDESVIPDPQDELNVEPVLIAKAHGMIHHLKHTRNNSSAN